MATIIQTAKLSKRYDHQFALKDLDLEVNEGEVLGYLGPNGAGKTTTIRLLLGLIAPTSGSARIFNLDAQRQAPEVHRHVAYVPGEANLWPGLTGHETLTLLGRVHGYADQAYREELIKRFDFDPAKKVRSYSKGNRQKLILIDARGAADSGRAVERAGPVDGAALQRMCRGGETTRTDGVLVVAHSQRSRSTV